MRLLRSLVSCLEIEIMRHRLPGIVIGSRATAVAIIFHYYCYRSAFPASPHLSSRIHSLSPFLSSLRPPRTVEIYCDDLRCTSPRRRIEITRVNSTFFSRSHFGMCVPSGVITRRPDRRGGWSSLKSCRIPIRSAVRIERGFDKRQ